MSNHWWDKFLDLFTEEVEDAHELPRNNNKDIRQLASKELVRQNRQPGRIEEGYRPVQPRMISQYSQRESSRTPDIDDRRGQVPRKPRRIRERTSTENMNNPVSPERKARRLRTLDSGRPITNKPQENRSRRRAKDVSRSETVKEKFTGVNFRAADVPSPVYGFRRRARGQQQYPIDREETEANNRMKDNEPNGDQIGELNETFRNEGEDAVHENRSSRVKKNISQSQEKDSPLRNHEKPYIENAGQRSLSRESESVPKPDQVSVRSGSQLKGTFRLPPLDLLSEIPGRLDEDAEWIAMQREQLSETLQHFNVNAMVTGYTKGPAVTRFELKPAPGEKVSKIKKLNDDLKLSLAVKDIRIEAPIPGTNAIGIEIPNRESQPVYLREMIESDVFRESDSPLTAALGRDITGKPIVTDLRKMPHGLIGGATGSGKSVCINSLLISLLFKASPQEVKFILIDPKVVELAPFKEIPHLAAPVINDAKEAAMALKWAVEEMERRYGLFVEVGARDISRYNSKAASNEQLPFIVIVIDELADLMMAAPQDVEESICRIAQKARACGIHLVLATQRPSVDVITGLIKANIPTRIAFSVSSQADSRTILDIGGAEKLLGHGDMLFVENGSSQSVRVQGNFVSDDEIDNITAFVKQQGRPDFLFEKEQLQSAQVDTDADDELFEEACFFVFEQGSASASSLQRKFRIGYNRAARLIDLMEMRGMISGSAGSKPRDVLISEEDFLESMIKGK